VDSDRLLPACGLALRLTAATVWLVAGTAKLADLERFHAQIRQYDLLPGALEAPFAYTLPLLEVGIGLYLLIGLSVRAAGIVASLLMVVFLAAQAQAWARGLSLDCGCFGALARERVGPTTIVRDIALGLPSLVMAIRPARAFSVDRRLHGRPDAFVLRTPDWPRSSPHSPVTPGKERYT